MRPLFWSNSNEPLAAESPPLAAVVAVLSNLPLKTLNLRKKNKNEIESEERWRT
jgi:hypothetical protein